MELKHSTYNFESNISLEEKKRILSEVRVLSVLQPALSTLSILLNWAIIMSAILIAYNAKSVWLSVCSVFIIGARQHALLILMHEGAHNRLLKNKTHNMYMSDVLCAFPLFLTTAKYKDFHLSHHKHLNTDKDPEWVLKRDSEEWKFPKKKVEIIVLLLKQLLGLNTLEILRKMYRYGIETKKDHKSSKATSSHKVTRFAFYLLLAGFLTVFHIWSIFLIYWIIPAFTILPLVLRIRSIAEHHGLEWTQELNSSRNVYAGFLVRFFFVPGSINYHLAHHLYPSVPFYNLKKLHLALLKNAVYSNEASNVNAYFSNESNSVFSQVSRRAQEYDMSMKNAAY